MGSPFKEKPGFDCRAKDLFDALTILHDLGLWDELTYEFAENPIGLINHVNENVDDFVEEWEKKNMGWTLRLINTNKKIQAIKHLRAFTGFGLPNSKKMIESAPFVYPWYYDTRKDLEASLFYKQLDDIPETVFEVVRLTPNQRRYAVKTSNARTRLETINGTSYYVFKVSATDFYRLNRLNEEV